MNPIRRFLFPGSDERAALSEAARESFNEFCEELFGCDVGAARYAEVHHDHDEASAVLTDSCGSAIAHPELANRMRDAARLKGAPRWPLEFLSATAAVMALCKGSSDTQPVLASRQRRASLRRALLRTASVCHAWVAELMVREYE